MQKKKTKAIALVVVMAIVAVALILALSGSKNAGTNVEGNNQTQTSQMQTNTLSDGLQITDEVAGTGTIAAAGGTVTVNYVGSLTDGTVFDASAKRGSRGFSFVLGANPPQVIDGWNEGIVGMKVGGKRKLVIPPSLAYGANGVPGVIPANATLVFEVELVDVQP